MKAYSIFVNTTDSFEDCWAPFFRLFSIFWPNYDGKVYLNTEYKTFSFEGINIVSLKNSLVTGNPPMTWSECLRKGLGMVEEDVILYMQEDYFLNSKVDDDMVTKYALLLKNDDIDCIHLTDQHSSGPFVGSSYRDLWKMGRTDFHKISCQAALWKTKVMARYIRSHENPWQFELYGTLRAQFGKNQFFTIPRNADNRVEREILPYVFTGVIQGKWFEQVVDLFRNNDIQMDFKRRGFITDRERFAFFPRLKRKLSDFNIKSIYGIIRLSFSKRSPL